jgi:NADH-quinone oxidoreductase subunit I
MFGRGLIKGFLETGKNFCGSYYDSSRLTTVQYPEQKLPPMESARTFPFLVYDGQDPIAGLRCTACTICEQECPAHCIEIVKETTKKPDYLGKMQLFPKSFDIDMAVCMACGICAEVCPFDSIKMDRTFEVASQRRDSVVGRDGLAKSNEYFREIHPVECAAIDAARAEEVAKAAAKKAAAPAVAPAPPPTAVLTP